MLNRILLVIGLIVAAAALVAAAMLLPAHRQIRQVDASVPTPAEVDAVLSSARGEGPVEIRYIDTASQSGTDISVSHTVAVLRWADGRLFLIDAGMDRAAAEEFGATIELLLDTGPVQTFGPVEEQLGEAVQAVRGIGFTHLHIDHTSGVSALCAAMESPAVIYQTHQQARLHNLHTEEGHRLVVESACQREVVGGETVAPVQGFPGLAVIAAGGHTPCSTIFLARVGEETWVFSGDLTNSLAEIREDRPKGWLYSYLLVPENPPLLARWRQWLRAVDDDATHVVVAHDLASYRDNGLLPWRGEP